MQMPTKWPTLTVSSSCVRATKGAPTAATLATAADVFKKSLRFMAVSGDRSGGHPVIAQGGTKRFPCITHAMGASRPCIHLRTQVSSEDLQMIKMRACCAWKPQDQSVAEVANETAKPERTGLERPVVLKQMSILAPTTRPSSPPPIV